MLGRTMSASEPMRRGRAAEARAARILTSAGFTLIACNYRCRMGELDLVARRGRLLVIAEVRQRSNGNFGGAAASITAAKRHRIVRAARHLLLCRPALSCLAVRFDALLIDGEDGPVEWIEAAFDATT
jgi:putative endonuclease